MTETQTERTETRRPPGDNAPRVFIGALLVAWGLLWILDLAGAIDIGLTVVLGLATMVVGVAIIVLSMRGPQAGLIVLGTVLALVTLFTSAAVFGGFRGGVGDVTVAPGSAAELEGEYNLAMGELVVDLREIDDLETGTTVAVSVGMGELTVIVPAGTDIEVQANVGAGEIDILGRTIDGVGIDQTYRPPSSADEPELILDLSALAGRVEVRDE